MKKNQLAYAKLCIEAEDFEKLVPHYVDNSFVDKAITLTDVEFDRNDRSVNLCFTIFMGEDELSEESYAERSLCMCSRNIVCLDNLHFVKHRYSPRSRG